jgi:ABC-2 type transport system permease protein
MLQVQHDQLEDMDIDDYLQKTSSALESKGALAQQAAVVAGRRAIEKMRTMPVHKLEFVNVAIADANLEALKQQVLGKELIAVIHIKADALTRTNEWLSGLGQAMGGVAEAILGGESGEADAEPSVVVYRDRTLHMENSDLITQRLSAAIVAAKVAKSNVNLIQMQTMMMPPDISVRDVTLTGEVETNEASNILVPMAFMMLLWITTFTGGQYLLTSTVEEKTSKVIEVLLSATSSMQLMTGKIIGQGAVAMTMLVIYAALAIGALQKFQLGYLIEMDKVLIIAPYFFMAFFFIACMMAAVGSAVNEMREAQALMMPVMMIVMMPLLAWLPIVKSPNGTFATVLSFIPPMTPFVMALRLASNQTIPPWQVAGTLVIGFAAVIVFLWMTAKIFRIGILMHGKAPNFMTLLRWVRQS